MPSRRVRPHPARGPSFPPELEREIFQIAALEDSSTICPLLRVCHRVHVWIEPLLYQVLKLNSEAAISGIAVALDTKPRSFFEKAVRHLWLVNFSREARDTSISLLRILPRVESLIITHSMYNFADHDFIRSLGDKCSRLGLIIHNPPSFWSQMLTDPICPFLTHLILHDPSNHGWHYWRRLADLPALTHLCLTQKFERYIECTVLEQCPRLHVLVRLWFQNNGPVEDMQFSITDSRLVVMWLAENYRADWEAGVRGGDDFWARAERFIERKLRGEIEKSCYLLTDSS
ncbi:hypothetical protein FB451DRAFT_1264721, partial [Mycena latifolia]